MTRAIRFTKPQLFAVLMMLAAFAALLPRSCTRWVGGVLQPLGWLSAPLASAGRAAAGTAAPTTDAEADALRRLVGQQSLTIQNLEQRVEELTSIRDQLRDVRTRLRIATVIAYDADPRRETLLIGRGSNDGLAVGQWVVACSAPPDRDATGRDVVLREWLIGRVSEVFPFASRVRLATDPQFQRERVRVARIVGDGTWQVIGNDCVLSGQGGGRMMLEKVAADLRAEGAAIVLAPAGADLPTELSLGRIVDSHTVADAPLFFNLDVRPWSDVRRMGAVYVIVPGR